MEAGLVETLWTIADLVGIINEWEAKQPREKVGRKPKAEKAS